MNTEDKKDSLSLALDQALIDVAELNQAGERSEQGEPSEAPTSGNDQDEPLAPDDNVKQQHETKPESDDGQEDEQNEQPGDKAEESLVPRSVLIKTRKRAQSAEALAQQETAERVALQAKLADVERQLSEAQAVGYEPREVPKSVTPELIQAMRDGDTDAIADYAEIMNQQGAIPPTDGVTSDEPQPQGPSPLELQETESGRQILGTLMEWRDDANDGIDGGTWKLAQEIEGEMRRDPQYSDVSTDVFYKNLVERTQQEIRTVGQAMARQQADSGEAMPESLSSAGNGGGAEAPDPIHQIMNLEGAELVKYLKQLSPQEKRQLGML